MFNNLFCLRFVLSLLVVFFHLNGNMKAYGVGGFDFPLFGNGTTAVFVFFVISGFLMHSTQFKHNKRKFYLKRAKRILPLYYLILLIGIALYVIGYFHKIEALNAPLFGLIFPLLLLPQIIYVKYRVFLGFIEVLWSIGIEVIYYIIFPFIKKLEFFILIFLIIIIAFIQTILVHPVYSNYLNYFLLGHLLSILNQKIKIRLHILALILFCLGLLRLCFLPEKITDILFYNNLFNLLSAAILVFGGIRMSYNLDNIYFVKKMGESSYALYLSHFFGILPVIYLGSLYNLSINIIFLLGSFTAILVGFFFNWIDQFLQRIKVPCKE